ncbi:hypothetical protein [Mediterraneibacter faecis]|uniref:hypothetical protein n=1 Tax=Mediterraneibacter faecis TaxID=592978 RepID=UPI0022E41A66|nr:hypothetical protein [Mediterraneibacter faecis]
MRVEECVKKLKSKGIIDSREIYIYASLKNIISGMFGSIRGLVLLCIYEDILYIYRANIDNSYGEQLAKIPIPYMKNIQGKAGLFGGKFSFNYDGKEYKFKLPAKAEKFMDFFVK